MFELFGTRGSITNPSATGTPMILIGDPAAFASGEDLPCPWCHASTAESDPRCPSCGRRFG